MRKPLKKFQRDGTPLPIPGRAPRIPGVNSPPSFERHGPLPPESPVVLSAPHAGREYPPALAAALRVPLPALRALEDRHVDLLALHARREETLFVASRARAWIDLNRSEQERDPMIDDGAQRIGRPPSAKLRSGLGIVPRRVGTLGQLWSRRFSDAEIVARIEQDHRPYHAALAQALAAAHQRFGIAVLLDIHSMPPLGSFGAVPQLVVGDRFGRAAAARFASCVAGVARRHGVAVAANVPYAGGHILERHGSPRGGIHALQLEFDRALYLDAGFDGPGAGVAMTTALLRAIIDAVTEEALPRALAAE